jgi:hypothetical protein
MKWIDLGTIYEFEDRLGVIRQTAGCSVVGHFQFSQRLNQLWGILAEAEADQTWVEIYKESARFRYLVKELLELNGLAADWFSPEQIGALLFGSEEQPGYLIQINTLRPSDNPKSAPTSLVEVIAGLAESLNEALELASQVPAQAMSDLSEARSELYATPEEREKRQRERQLKQYKADPPSFRELMNRGE